MAKSVTDVAIMFGALESAAPDPNDPATTACTPPPGRDYTKFLKARRPEGRAHRHPARVLLRRVHAARSAAAGGGRGTRRTRWWRGRRQRPERRSEEGDGRGDRRPQGAGRDHRRSRGHPERRRSRSEEQLPALERLLGREQRQGQGRGLLGRPEVRDEARLQQLAEVARRRGAGEDADRAARVEHGAREGRARSSTGSRTSTSPTRWTSRRIARATRPIARRTSGWPARTASTR